MQIGMMKSREMSKTGGGGGGGGGVRKLRGILELDKGEQES